MLRNINFLLADTSVNLSTPSLTRIKGGYEEVYKYIDNHGFNEYYYKYSKELVAPIYRGCSYYGQYFMRIPDYRVSANTSNIYTFYTSNLLPSWKDKPKRNKSFICSLSRLYAENFGEELYAVFPHNDAKIGICPNDDLWDSFNITNLFESSASLININKAFINIFKFKFIKEYITYITNNIENEGNENLEKLYTIIDLVEEYAPKSKKCLELINQANPAIDKIIKELTTLRPIWSEIISTLLNVVEKINSNSTGNNKLKTMLEYYNEEKTLENYVIIQFITCIISGKTEIDVLDRILNFDTNGFSYCTGSTFDIKPSKNNINEVWIEGPCLFADLGDSWDDDDE